MSNQYPNPIRGYVPCAHCHAPSTVHSVGEGKLIATGETPKNARSIGKMYYRCPNCGNQTPSKKITEYIDAHRVENQEDLLSADAVQDSAKNSATVAGDSATVENALASKINASEGGSALNVALEGELVDEQALQSAIESATQTFDEAREINASSANEEDEKESRSFIAWTVGILVLVGATWLIWGMLKPKVKSNNDIEVSHG